MSANDDRDDMKLPEGKTCADCAHAHRCEIFGFTPALTETTCSWSPSRFRLPRARPGTEAEK